jgi:hypothetical protein
MRTVAAAPMAEKKAAARYVAEKWTEEHTRDLQWLVTELRKNTVRALYDPGRTLYVSGDSSNAGIGLLLYQFFVGKRMYVAVHSVRFTGSQLKWGIGVRELYGWVQVARRYWWWLYEATVVWLNDHHNLLITPAAVPNLNHYALEMDGIDAIGLAGQKIVAERPDCSVTGVGRHVVGANMFWYLLDPAGGMFELYSDMDQIVDDEKWAAENHRTDWNPFEVAAWNSTAIKPDFFEPVDIADIAKGREAAGR